MYKHISLGELFGCILCDCPIAQSRLGGRVIQAEDLDTEIHIEAAIISKGIEAYGANFLKVASSAKRIEKGG